MTSIRKLRDMLVGGIKKDAHETKLLQLVDYHADERGGAFALRALELGRWGETGMVWGMPHSHTEIYCPLEDEIVIRSDKNDPRMVSVYRRKVVK